MDGLNPQAWRDFFMVAGTAAAALLGLVLVAISLHVEKVEGHPLLRNRARSSLQTLGLILVLSLVALMPGITAFWFGVLTLVVDAAGLALLVWGLWTANQQARGLRLVCGCDRFPMPSFFWGLRRESGSRLARAQAST